MNKYLKQLDKQLNDSCLTLIQELSMQKEKFKSDEDNGESLKTLLSNMLYLIKYEIQDNIILYERKNIVSHIISNKMTKEESKSFITDEIIALSCFLSRPFQQNKFEQITKEARLVALRMTLDSLDEICLN